MRLGKVRFESQYIAIQYFYKNKGLSIRWMCEQLGITRAAYYKWLHRDIPEAEQENILIAQLIRDYDDRFNHILGYRRMTLYINRLNNKHYSKNRIHRIMKVLNIHSVIRRKRKKYQSSTPETTAENLLNRNFYAPGPNQKWSTDVTEFKWYEGPVVHKVYLSAILDLYDRRIVAYIIRDRNDNPLVFDTLDAAIEANPNAHPLFHSDRGFQYTNRAFYNKLKAAKMKQSMSRVAKCIDNGPMEGFWGILKRERYYGRRFTSRNELVSMIENYITYYNNRRVQRNLGVLTPMEKHEYYLMAA